MRQREQREQYPGRREIGSQGVAPCPVIFIRAGRRLQWANADARWRSRTFGGVHREGGGQQRRVNLPGWTWPTSRLAQLDDRVVESVARRLTHVWVDQPPAKHSFAFHPDSFEHACGRDILDVARPVIWTSTY